jgi:hypothetical protein
MKSKDQETKQRHVFLKSYPRFEQIEAAVKMLQPIKGNNMQVSILGKLNTKSYKNEKKSIYSENELKTHCEAMFQLPIDFGIISNPEIGKIFIAGSFAPMFLQEINGKKLGSMSMGLYGVLRGLGIDQERVTSYLKALLNGEYLIVLRGYDKELNLWEDKLR